MHIEAPLAELLAQARCGARLAVSKDTAWAECRGGEVSLHPDVVAAGPGIVLAAVAHEVAHLRHRHARKSTWGRFLVMMIALVCAIATLDAFGWVAAVVALLAVKLTSSLLGSAALRAFEAQADWSGSRLLETAVPEADGPALMARALEEGNRRRLVLPQRSLSAPESPALLRAWVRAKYFWDVSLAEHAPVDLRIERLRSLPFSRGYVCSLRDAWLAPVTVALRDLRQ